MKLVIFRGDAVEAEVQLRPGVIKLGRDARNDVVLDDPQKGVSRFHCEIRTEKRRSVITDTKSRNGLLVAGRRVNGSVELSLGVPVVVGPFELMLEDEVTASSDESSAVIVPPKVQTTTSGSTAGGTQRAASVQALSKSRLPAWLASSRNQIGLAVVAALAILGGIAGVVYYNLSAPTQTIAQAPLAEPLPAPEPAPPSQEAQTARQIDDALLALQNAISMKDVEGAKQNLKQLEELDPQNPNLPELRRQTDELEAKPATPVLIERVPPKKPAAPAAETEDPDVPRLANEDYGAYRARVARIEAAYRLGLDELNREEYARAISYFSSVRRESPGPAYRDVAQKLSEATTRQTKAVGDAIDYGEQNQRNGKLKEEVIDGWQMLL